MTTRRAGSKTRARRFYAHALILSLVSMLFPVLGATSAAAAGDPEHVSFTLEGCRLPAGATLPSSKICPDNQYTTGNLGKSWNELDLVPHRVTLRNDGPSQTYEFKIAGDFRNGGATGWDIVSLPRLNAAKSTGTCAADLGGTDASYQITPVGAGVGGADQTIYRVATITQAANTTCVYDYVQRLALGAHLFSGSSLQSNLWNQSLTSSGIGQKRLGLPVGEIEPQDIDKTMSATENVGHSWSLTKSAALVGSAFGNTCDASQRAGLVQIDLSWTKTATADGITVSTQVTADNPSHRAVSVSVSDVVYGSLPGASAESVLGTQSATVTVPANTSGYALFRDSSGPAPYVISGIASGTTGLRDEATATYTDIEFPGIAIPGNTTATASTSVQQLATGANESAVITDTETLTGSDYTYRVNNTTTHPAPAGTYETVDSAGVVTGTYTPGSDTQSSVKWTSGPQTASGSTTFYKTITATQATQQQVTLADAAELVSGTGNDQITRTQTGSVSVTAGASTTLTVNKTIQEVLEAGENYTFTFNAMSGTTNLGSTSISFGPGDGGTSAAKSSTITLPPGTYSVEEPTVQPYAPQAPQTANMTLPSNCTRTLTFNNGFADATARVMKVTNPVGSEAGWNFTLTFPNGTTIRTALTDDGDWQSFGSLAAEGTYLITENKTSAQASWDLTNVAGGTGVTANGTSCSFTINYPADAGNVYDCTFTNTQRGQVQVLKTQSGGALPAGTSYNFDIRQGAAKTAGATGTILDADVTDANGLVDFDGLAPGLTAGTYQVCETNLMPGWHSSLSDMTGAFTPGQDANLVPGQEGSVDNSTVCVSFTLTAGQTQTFNVDNTPPPGGDARTIGYWKNHSSCTGGNQAHVLDAVMGAGISIGSLTLTACQDAVRILSKSTLRGKKMSSDAAYNMAAQLLAAKLNERAGAGVCADASAAIAAGDALLTAINFTGNGEYLGSKVKGTKATQRAQANALSAILDAYNNNDLC